MRHQLSYDRIYGYSFYLVIILFFASGLNGVRAQANPNTVYVGYTYIKTVPGKFDGYDSLLRNYTSKVFDDQVKTGNFLSWSIYEVLMPSGSESQYDVVGVAVTNKIEMLLDPPGTNKEIMAKTFPNMSQKQRDDVMKRFADSRSIVKREIYQVLSSTNESGPPTKQPAKYVQVDFMTPAQGKAQDYVKMESETFRPVHKERIKLGALEGWVLLSKVLPADTEDPAPYVTVNFYNDFGGLMDGKYDQAVKAAYPDKDADKLFESVGTVKKRQRIEVWKLMTTDNSQRVAAK
jgi:hypothetical protein